MSYRLSRRADNELGAIYEESVERFGVVQAETYYASLTDAFAYLAGSPRAVREREEIGPGIRAYRHQAHMIVYRIESEAEQDEEEHILIIRLPHVRSDWLNELD